MNTKKIDLQKNRAMLTGRFKKRGFMLWRYTFNGINAKTGDHKVFFIEFFIINPINSPHERVFGQLYEQKAKSHHPSYIMVKAGAWGENSKQIHAFYPISDLHVNKRKFDLKVDSIHITETSLTGDVFMSQADVMQHPEYMSNFGTMSWDLTMKKTRPYNPPKKTNWHVAGIKTYYSGTVVFDGAEYVIIPEKSFGYADKTWGRDFFSPLFWLSASNLISDITQKPLENCCFAIGAGSSHSHAHREQHLPKLLAIFYYEGIKCEFPLTFFHKKSRVKVDFIENENDLHWLVTAETKKYLLDVDIFCPKKETIFMNYESPNGHKYHNNLWCGGTGIGQIKFFKKTGQKLEMIESARVENAGCQYGEFDMLDFM